MHAKLQIAISRFMASFIFQKKIQMLFIQGPISAYVSVTFLLVMALPFTTHLVFVNLKMDMK